MRIRQRIEKLEKEHPPPNGAQWRPQTDEEWLGLVEARGKQGFFAGEPEFPAAVAYYRQAIQDAAARSDPPFYPPDDYLPGMPENERRRGWRSKSHYPDLNAAFFWLSEMRTRVRNGKPPVTEAEFRELEAWFRRNEDRLPLNGPIDIGDGRKVYRGELRGALSRGPRASGVTELVETLRRLKDLLH
jgi:hypothetical protein